MIKTKPKYQIIDLNNWKGKKHYDWFIQYATPYYGVTSKIDITKFFKYLKQYDYPFFPSFMFLITKVLNTIDEFRLRIIDDRKLVLFETIHPAFTVMTVDEVYDNCDVELSDFKTYLKNIKAKMETVKMGVREDISYNDQSRYDQYYISCLPWIDFTAVSHPMTDNRYDSVPRIVWGKYYYHEECLYLSVQIQVNHALIDGYPLSKGFLKIQEAANNPEKYLI